MTGKTTEAATLFINAIRDQACARSVRGALEAIEGVEAVTLDPQGRFVTLRFDPCRVKPAQFRTAVRVVGCRVTSIVLAGDDEQSEMPARDPVPQLLRALR